MKPKYPANKQFFKKLVPFTQRILKLCGKNKITPIIHGSFAHFYHTKDEKMRVNDIDIMVCRKDFYKMIKLLEDNKIKFKHYPKWEIIIIKKGRLQVEVDMPGGYKLLNQRNLSRVTRKIDFYGIKVKMVTLRQLENIYQVAYARSTEDKAKIFRKIKHLEKFLGRKLK